MLTAIIEPASLSPLDTCIAIHSFILIANSILCYLGSYAALADLPSLNSASSCYVYEGIAADAGAQFLDIFKVHVLCDSL